MTPYRPTEERHPQSKMHFSESPVNQDLGGYFRVADQADGT